jgi:DNA-binding transcriptional MocR family regulator
VSFDRSKVDLSGRTPIGHGPTPTLWQGFADDLIRQIETGVLEPGDEVSVRPQMEEWKCGLSTAAKVLEHLCRRGLLLKPSRPCQPYRVSGDDSWMRVSDGTPR